MKKGIPFYIMTIDQDVDGMDYMGLVDAPAHMKGYQRFAKQVKGSKITDIRIKDQFNEEKCRSQEWPLQWIFQYTGMMRRLVSIM